MVMEAKFDLAGDISGLLFSTPVDGIDVSVKLAMEFPRDDDKISLVSIVEIDETFLGAELAILSELL